MVALKKLIEQFDESISVFDFYIYNLDFTAFGHMSLSYIILLIYLCMRELSLLQ